MVGAWRVAARDGALFQLGPVDVFTELKLVLRLRRAGTWEMTLPADHPQASHFATPGAGLIVWAPWSQERPLMSGPMLSPRMTTRSRDKGATVTVAGVDDTALLADRLVLPDPTSEMHTQSVESYATEGLTEKVLRDLVDANAGDAALPARRLCDADPDDRRSTSLLVGVERTVSCRFDNLLAICEQVAKLDGLAMEVVQPSATVQDRHFRVWQPVDRSGSVRLSQYAGTLNAGSVTLAAPTATHVLVAGSGEGAARTLQQRSNDAMAASWARRVESFRDARDTSDPVLLAQRGDEALAEGAAAAGLSIEPVDTSTQQFGTHYGLGDLISVEVNGTTWTDVVSGVEITINRDGVRTVPMIGDSDAADAKSLALYSRVREVMQRLDRLERRQ